jgi:hypothetical protein
LITGVSLFLILSAHTLGEKSDEIAR